MPWVSVDWNFDSTLPYQSYSWAQDHQADTLWLWLLRTQKASDWTDLVTRCLPDSMDTESHSSPIQPLCQQSQTACCFAFLRTFHQAAFPRNRPIPSLWTILFALRFCRTDHTQALPLRCSHLASLWRTWNSIGPLQFSAHSPPMSSLRKMGHSCSPISASASQWISTSMWGRKERCKRRMRCDT